jgi:hypothetical protein
MRSDRAIDTRQMVKHHVGIQALAEIEESCSPILNEREVVVFHKRHEIIILPGEPGRGLAQNPPVTLLLSRMIGGS